MARVGGGCFSGKCPTKVDRSGAYGARYVAKNIVANNLADRCEVQVAYVIGKPKPVAYAINTFNTQKKKPSIIKDFAKKLLNMSVPNILKTLNLRQPIYQKTATYGHFGRPEFPWEKITG
ncbi:MAG: methionine adenosyltransferase [Patescibacteria group bacterium]|nr:methionine adenosyltransferase [Patescibacteria group bacterium]